jgi:hypothetical protein
VNCGNSTTRIGKSTLDFSPENGDSYARVGSFLLLLSVAAFAKDKPTITIQVVSSEASTRQFTRTTPGQAGTSQTNCDTNGTATDYGNTGTTNMNANPSCTTTTTTATPPRTYVTSIPEEHVYVIMPDGGHVKLWCQNGFRRCAYLQPGSYTAEASGNSLFIHAHELSGKERKIKYRAVGGF